jgi:undecaprenyl pyrophosphate phosphatase UppP
MFDVGAVWMLSTQRSTTTVLWLTLFVCWIGTLVAVVLGILFRRHFLWWLASTLTVLAIVLSVSLAMLDRLGSK